MEILRTDTVKSLRSKFTKQFPGLKFEIYKNTHNYEEGSPSKDQYSDETSLASISPKMVEGVLILEENMEVQEFENLMTERFGLYTQVFRKSNDLWIQSTKTDKWTLAKQNLKGIHSQQNK